MEATSPLFHINRQEIEYQSLACIDFMMNQDLLTNYIDLIKSEGSKYTYNNLESLFLMAFFELQDLLHKCIKPSGKENARQRMKIAKLKEIISIVLVKGEFYDVLHYVMTDCSKLNGSKLSYKSKEVRVNQGSRIVGGLCLIEEFNPFMYPDVEIIKE